MGKDFEEEFNELLGEILDDDEFCKDISIDDLEWFGPKRIYNLDVVAIIDKEEMSSKLLKRIIVSLDKLYSALEHGYHKRRKILNKFNMKLICIKKNNLLNDYVFTSSKFYSLPNEKERFKSYLSQIESIGSDEKVSDIFYILKNLLYSKWDNTLLEGEYKRNIILFFSENSMGRFYTDNMSVLSQISNMLHFPKNHNYKNYFDTFLFTNKEIESSLFELQMMPGVCSYNINELEEDTSFITDLLVYKLCGDLL